MLKIRILGVPLDLGQERRGVDMGPSAVRAAGLNDTLKSLGHTVEDSGNIHVRLPEEQHYGDQRAKYLNEIAETSPALQSKLLRVLQERTFERVGGTDTVSCNFRVIAATNRDLEASVRERVFREDLFYRLNVVRIEVPPLRERRSDIVPLAEHFLRIYSEKNALSAIGFSDDVILMLQNYSYPGNVREL